jgi:hypothetical protein
MSKAQKRSIGSIGQLARRRNNFIFWPQAVVLAVGGPVRRRL